MTYLKNTIICAGLFIVFALYGAGTVYAQDTSQFVIRTYQQFLNREPDEEGFIYWTEKINQNSLNASHLLKQFINSDEFELRQVSDEDFLEIIYISCMGRNSDAEGKAYWLDILHAGASRVFVLRSFVRSQEFSQICSAYGMTAGDIELTEARDINLSVTRFVRRCYQHFLSREPDIDGLNYWCETLLSGNRLPSNVVRGFIKSSEFQSLNLSDEAYLAALYRGIFGREMDAGGYQYWVEKLNNGTSRSMAMNGFLGSDEFSQMVGSYGLSSEFGMGSYTVTQYPGTTGGQCTIYTITCPDGSLVIVDGGYKSDAAYLRQIIKENGNVVSAWILTHPHGDHIGAFLEIWQDPQGVNIQKVYAPDIDYIRYYTTANDYDEFFLFEEFLQITAGDSRINYVHSGDKWEIGGMEFNVLSAYDNFVAQGTADLANDGAIMFTIASAREKMLFCADVGARMSDYLIEKYGSSLKANYLQMGHHGNGGLSKDFYRLVAPKVAFFDAPEWLMNNLDPITLLPASYTTPQNRALMESLGAAIYSFITAPNTIIMS